MGSGHHGVLSDVYMGQDISDLIPLPLDVRVNQELIFVLSPETSGLFLSWLPQVLKPLSISDTGIRYEKFGNPSAH